jgi:PAS domain-containing protein
MQRGDALRSRELTARAMLPYERGRGADGPMTQKPVEMILMRQLASSLAMPVFLVDLAGTLVFYNEPAEEILGLRFDETGEMPASEWGTRWEPSTADGSPLAPDALPLMVAIAERRPAHETFWIRRHDGGRRRIQVTAIPLVATPDRLLGAAAIFFEDGG